MKIPASVQDLPFEFLDIGDHRAGRDAVPPLVQHRCGEVLGGAEPLAPLLGRPDPATTSADSGSPVST